MTQPVNSISSTPNLPRIIHGIDELKQLINKEVAITNYFQISQERIIQFAEVTEDKQWIHVDMERAKTQSPYKTTIAHGFLTLSLLSHLLLTAVQVNGIQTMINYGLNYVRFPAIVPANTDIRAHITLHSLEDIPNGLQVTWKIIIKCKNSEKPSCVAEWLTRYYI